MTTEVRPSVQLTRRVNAPPEAVFRAWTEPSELKRWSAPEGVDVADAQVDLSVGGAYEILMRNTEGEEFTAYGTYREIDPARKLVYTWNWSAERHDVGETLVTVEFNPAGDGTQVVLTHGGFPNAEAATGHERGWTSCLVRLLRAFPEAA